MKQTKSKQIRYLADCPKCICKLGIKEIVRVNPTKTSPGYRKCKKHGGLVIAAELVCDTCGESFQVEIQRVSTKTCWKCKEKIKEATILWKKEKKARGVAKEQKKIAAVKKRRLAIEAKKQIKLKPKKPAHKPIVPVKGSYHWRGDFCNGIVACNLRGPLKCDTCKEFVGVYFGYDPKKLGLWA